jgi:hypothetical protein
MSIRAQIRSSCKARRAKDPTYVEIVIVTGIMQCDIYYLRPRDSSRRESLESILKIYVIVLYATLSVTFTFPIWFRESPGRGKV